MNAQDRKRLEQAQFTPEIIAKTDDVLRLWEIDELFVLCSYCHTACIHPDVRNRQFRRKKPPAELFWKFPLGFYDHDSSVICEACDDAQFQ